MQESEKINDLNLFVALVNIKRGKNSILLNKSTQKYNKIEYNQRRILRVKKNSTHSVSEDFEKKTIVTLRDEQHYHPCIKFCLS